MPFLSFVFGLILTAMPPSAQSLGALQIKGPNAQASGRVVEESTDTPISGARVVFAFRGRSRYQAVTDGDGRYSFEELEPGPYRLSVQKAGYVPLDPATVPTYWVVAGQSLDVATVSLQKGGVIAGRVLGSSGAPMADINVRAVKPGAAIDLMGEASRTDDLGEFRVFGLAPGDYMIVASPRPRGSDALSRTMASSTFYPGTADPSLARLLSVRAGQTVTGVEFRTLMASTFTVAGTVTDGLGMPVAGVTVIMAGDSRSSGLAAGTAGETRSDLTGKFSITAVTPGRYYAATTAPPSDPVEVIVDDTDVRGVSIVVRRQ
jgi:Carboxypeptidase regulatory-like domain